MNEQDFQSIFEELQKVTPNDWERIAFYAEYSEGSYSMKFYVKSNDTYTDCFNLPDINKSELIKTFMKIDSVIKPIREHIPSEKKFNVLTIIISSDGKFNADFDYTDIQDNVLVYHKNWENKYLK